MASISPALANMSRDEEILLTPDGPGCKVKTAALARLIGKAREEASEMTRKAIYQAVYRDRNQDLIEQAAQDQQQ